MKKLLLFVVMLVANVTMYSQTAVENPQGPIDPPSEPAPYMYTCGPLCFENRTNCYIEFGVSSDLVVDPCSAEGGGHAFYSGRIILLPGEVKCVDFGINPITGCSYCVSGYKVGICGLNSAPCFHFDQYFNGGFGVINCETSLIFVGHEPNNPNWIIK